jgi:hypothetical protein
VIPHVKIARHLVTNAEWIEFIAAGGYTTASLWLSDGWVVVQTEGWQAPGYWRQKDDGWHAMTLAGLKQIDPGSPVQHVSYYEADAFARFAGRHLPSEAEWEVACTRERDRGRFWHRLAMDAECLSTVSGYRAAEGALGEYNGKFMINQMVLRGSRWRLQTATSALVTVTSFIHRPAGNSLACVWPNSCEGVTMVAAVAHKRISSQSAEVSEFEADVLEGLSAIPKHVPAKYFYDAAGSQLFRAHSPSCPNIIRRVARSAFCATMAPTLQSSFRRARFGGIRERLKQESSYPA